MGFFSNLITEKRESFSMKNPPEILKNIFGGITTKAGVTVNESSALSLTAVWACVTIIARNMAAFPLPVYERLDPGKRRAPEHPMYRLLHTKPNPRMTSFMWRMVTSLHQNLWGAGVSEIEFNAQGYPVALWPIHPGRVRPACTINDELIYEVTLKTGVVKKLWPEQLLIFPFMPTEDGGWLSPIAVHRETIGAAIAVKEFGARSFGQGINPAGILSGVVFGEEDTEESLRKKYGAYEGLGQTGRLMLVEEGLKFDKIGLPPEDAQYLETRTADVAEIGRIYNMPLFMLQEHQGSTTWGTGLSEMKDGLVTFTFRPGCIQWEQELNTKLLDDGERFFCEFLMDGMLRGNFKDRMLGYRIASDLALYDRNEMREMENRNPLPGKLGTARLVPMNMQTLENAINGGKDAETGK